MLGDGADSSAEQFTKYSAHENTARPRFSQGFSDLYVGARERRYSDKGDYPMHEVVVKRSVWKRVSWLERSQHAEMPGFESRIGFILTLCVPYPAWDFGSLASYRLP